MKIPISLEVLSSILSAIIIPFFFWAYRQYTSTKGEMFGKLDTIKDHVIKVNGRVGKLETWVETHEEQDERNFTRYLKDQEDIKQLIRDTKGGH